MCGVRQNSHSTERQQFQSYVSLGVNVPFFCDRLNLRKSEHYRKFHTELAGVLQEAQVAGDGDQSFIDEINKVKTARNDGKTQQTLHDFVKKPDQTDAQLLGIRRRVAQHLLHIAEAIPLDKADSPAFKALGEIYDAKVHPSQSLRDRERQLFTILNTFRVEELSDALGVSVTADGWKSPSDDQSCIGGTFHWVNAQWQLKSVVLFRFPRCF